MGVEIIVHRGYCDFDDNSLIGIVAALTRGRMCELDVLYINNEWVLCHDVGAYDKKVSLFQELTSLLRKYPSYWKNALLIDIKWDYILDPSDVGTAIEKLWDMLTPFENCPVWLQAGCDAVLAEILIRKRQMSDACSSWRVGKIIRSVDESIRLQGIIDFATIEVSLFSMREIVSMRESYYVIGYTCTNMDHFRFYLKYNNIIDALVCDLTMSDENLIRKKRSTTIE